MRVPEKRKFWEDAEFFNVLEDLDDNTSVIHVGVPGWGPVSKREFMNVRYSSYIEDDVYFESYISIKRNEKTKDKKFIRGTLLPSGTYVKQVEGGCYVHYFGRIIYYFLKKNLIKKLEWI